MGAHPMKHTPLVTVYITNYNYGSYIREAIDSVLNQTYPNIELIIIDDGSTDESKTIIETYQNKSRVQVLFQQNKGLNATNNVALNLAKGKYFIRLDADDYFEVYAIALMVSFLEGRPEIGLLFPDYFYVDELGNIIGVESRHDFDREVRLFDLPSHGACTMVRTDELRKLGGYNEDFSCQDGYELWLKYVLNSKVSNISKPLFFYRQHKKSLTQNETKILETRKKIKKYCLDLYQITQPRSVVIIPVKPSTIEGKFWALHERNGKTELYWALKKLLDSQCFEELIVTSSNKKILGELERIKKLPEIECYGLTINGYWRNQELELANHSLDLTIKEIIKHFALERYEAIGLLGIETPLLKCSTIKEALHTLALYHSDSVISVHKDQASYFIHNGEGMSLVFEKSKYNNYERKVIYKRVSGFSITRMSAYLHNSSFLQKRQGHVEISSIETLTIQTDLDYKFLMHLCGE
jgi:glycosyltransferase involved in cell wall biosynthesis